MKYNLLKYPENEEKFQHLNIFIYFKLKNIDYTKLWLYFTENKT